MPKSVRGVERQFEWRLAVDIVSIVMASLLLNGSFLIAAKAQEAIGNPTSAASMAGPGIPPAGAATIVEPAFPIGRTTPSGEVASDLPVNSAVMPPPQDKSKSTTIQHDLSPMGMFWAADPIVKGVMILLAVSSVVTWTVFAVQIFSLMFAKRRMRRTIDSLRSAGGLADANETIKKGYGARLLHEAAYEAQLSRGLPTEGVKERVHIALSRIEAFMCRRMAVGTGILATIGSVGPFVGLFGTVWGIMRSFIGIANSNTTNLAVVAPGIAEALLATGIGLVAAIPAVVIYNALTRSIGAYRAMTADAVALIMRHLSRDLDRRDLERSIHNDANVRLAAE